MFLLIFHTLADFVRFPHTTSKLPNRILKAESTNVHNPDAACVRFNAPSRDICILLTKNKLLLDYVISEYKIDCPRPRTRIGLK